MRSGGDQSALEVEYQNLLNVLIRTGKYFEGLDIDPAVLKSYKQLLRYLRARPASSLPEILGGVASTRAGVSTEQKEALSDQEILSMTSERILNLASDREIPRREIERIASVRFGVTRGGLSNLRTRQSLVEKLRTLIQNEGTHESITRAATQ